MKNISVSLEMWAIPIRNQGIYSPQIEIEYVLVVSPTISLIWQILCKIFALRIAKTLKMSLNLIFSFSWKYIAYAKYCKNGFLAKMLFIFFFNICLLMSFPILLCKQVWWKKKSNSFKKGACCFLNIENHWTKFDKQICVYLEVPLHKVYKW